MSSIVYTLEKALYTDADFAAMGWHDNHVHAVAFGHDAHELSLDIDYILKWEQPPIGDQYYHFWISPATLVFEDVVELSLQHEFYTGVCILSVEREEYRKG